MGVSVGVGGVGSSVDAGIGDCSGALTDSGLDVCGGGIRGALDGPTLVVMATATVTGEFVCGVVHDVTGEPDTRLAGLPESDSVAGSAFGGGLSP